MTAAEIQPETDLSRDRGPVTVRGQSDGSVGLSDLLDVLAHRRKTLAIGYFGLMTVLAALFLFLGVALFVPEIYIQVLRHILLGADIEFWGFGDLVGFSWLRILIVLGFFGSQALFIWGGGRVRITRRPTRLHRRLCQLIIFGILVTGLLVGLLACFAEFGDRAGTEGSVREIGNLDLESLTGTLLLSLLGLSWLFWMVVAWFYVRGSSQYTGLARLSGALVAGSWIEFAVALAVEMGIRPRSNFCVCETGSWLTLVVCVPMLLWTIGPAIFVLYLREKHQAKENAGRTRRVLVRKSVRSPAAKVVP